jgi:hypothetical protein
MSQHTEVIEKELIDIYMKIILTDDEQTQEHLRDIYRYRYEQLKKQKEWEEVLAEPVDMSHRDGCPCDICRSRNR